MTFRTRLLAAFGVVVLVPLLVFGLGVRREMSHRIAAQYEQRVAALVGVIQGSVAREADGISARLAALKAGTLADNRFRTALVRGEDRAYVLDYTGEAMRLAGLDFLQIQDDEGRVISSGHFRNEFDRLGPALPGAAGALALLRAATAEGPFLTLAVSDSLRIAGRPLRLLGGITLDSLFLARLSPDPELRVSVALPLSSPAADTAGAGGAGGAGGTGGAARVVGEVTLPYVDAVDGPGRVELARIVVTQSPGLLAALERNVNLWFAVAVLLATLAALLIAGWLSTRISTPIEAGIRDMERRIAIGDLARQVNHDVKNGLAPLRNVFRHLTQVARDEPAKLPEVFRERQGTVESSVAYLETLAANYARLYPQSERRPTDVNAVVREAVAGAGPVSTKLADGLPPVSADALVLRRVIENLLRNAVDSLESKAGTVTVATERGNGMVRISVSDTGRGMSKSELDRAFDDFYTTKPGGTGLGLSIVRRLVLDSNGSLKVETEPGKGSRFIVEIPVQ
jgi:signal transduction histidine kinase